MGGKGRRQDHLALLVQLGRLAGMNGRRRHEAEGGVVVLVVVPAKELLAPGTGVLDAAKAAGKGRMVLDRLELGFRKGVGLKRQMHPYQTVRLQLSRSLTRFIL